MKTCPHGKDDRLLVSGTMLRKWLSQGEEVPDHFSRPEVVTILKEYYASLEEKVEINFTNMQKETRRRRGVCRRPSIGRS